MRGEVRRGSREGKNTRGDVRGGETGERWRQEVRRGAEDGEEEEKWEQERRNRWQTEEEEEEKRGRDGERRSGGGRV